MTPEPQVRKVKKATKVTPELLAHRAKKATRAIRATPEPQVRKVKKATRAIRAIPERREPTERRPLSEKTATGGLVRPTQV